MLTAKSIKSTRSHNIRRDKSPAKDRAEGDMMQNKKATEDRRSPYSIRKLRPPKRLFSKWNAPYAKKRSS